MYSLYKERTACRIVVTMATSLTNSSSSWLHLIGRLLQVTVGLISRRGRRGRPPKMAVTALTAERRRERLQEVRESCYRCGLSV